MIRSGRRRSRRLGIHACISQLRAVSSYEIGSVLSVVQLSVWRASGEAWSTLHRDEASQPDLPRLNMNSWLRKNSPMPIIVVTLSPGSTGQWLDPLHNQSSVACAMIAQDAGATVEQLSYPAGRRSPEARASACKRLATRASRDEPSCGDSTVLCAFDHQNSDCS